MTKKKELTKKTSKPFLKPTKKSKPVRKTKNNKELELRRVREWELALLGESTKNIAKQFNISDRQVRLDIDKVASEGGKEYMRQKMEAIFYNHDEQYKRRTRKLWEIVIGGKATNDELIRAIKELRHESVECFKKEQSAGLVPKEVSALIDIDNSTSEGGIADNRVQINIISPSKSKNKELRDDGEDDDND